MTKVYAGIHMSSAEENRELLRALEAGMRSARHPAPDLLKWWVQLRNMRWRAFTEGWGGWE